jgi:uncharacterized protein YdeI (YjbR/CyaY-like superfamily)
MSKIPELYFKADTAWREWLEANHDKFDGVYLVFYKVAHENDSMRWEEAVQVALCFGWIDSTVKSLGDGKRKQYFCPRKPKSAWSKLNKTYIESLLAENLMHESGLIKVYQAKEDGSWFHLDGVEDGIVPDDLQRAFNKAPEAFKNYLAFSRTYQKSYLYWLNQAKRPATREGRIREIVRLCGENIKSRN